MHATSTIRARPRWAWLRARFGRLAAVVLGAMQLLSVAMCMQLSGMAHATADVLERVTCTSNDCDHDRARDDGDEECPPGCPTCHGCAHAQVPYTSRSADVLASPVLLVAERGRVDSTVPPSRPLPSVFRPPRSLRFAQS